MMILFARARRRLSAPLAMLAAVLLLPAGPALASNGAEIDAKADLALERLLGESETAREVNDRAVAVLVFPDIVKAGFGVGGQYGEGALRRDGGTIGYYNIAAASFGLQIGAQSFSQAIFFMTEDALDFFERSEGFELGADAKVALANEGLGYNVTTSTIQDPIIAFVFGQQGLMAGVTIEGSKITEIER
jgi:lipid-binding SYLF domain-containing protein